MPTHNELYFDHTDMSYLPSLKFLVYLVVSSIEIFASVVAADDTFFVDSVVSTGTVLAAAKRISN